VDIEQHLAEHEEVLRALAFQYGRYDKDLREDCYQAGVLALMEAHERWTYHGAKLLTYAWHDVRKAMLKQVKLVKTEYRYGIKEELDTLQEIAERQDRNRLHLDRLYDEPIEGLKTPLESTLSEDEDKLAQKLLANLTDEELAILEAKVGRSDEEAAAFLDMPQTTYWRKKKAAQAKARELAQGLLSNTRE
jgi:RNA polymerase sigma factor (sigma-70 family)